MNPIRELCTRQEGGTAVLQGNIAFAVGCVRAGIHAVDGYPGTPSTEVIDKGLSQVQDMISVGWSVSEATAVATAHGYSMGGKDCVVTMKIPGLFQAGDIFSSSAFFNEQTGALVYYVATDFTPSSTQHVVDPRPFIKSCFVPIIEPRNHQELHEAAGTAADISREYRTPVVVLVSGTLCHSEGLVRLCQRKTRPQVAALESFKPFVTLPFNARKNYDRVITERLPRMEKLVEDSPLHCWGKGSGTMGVVTYGVGEMMVREVKQSLGKDFDILSLGFSWPLPMKLLREFYDAMNGNVRVVEDGYRYLQGEMHRAGMPVTGLAATDTLTEWNPAQVAEFLGFDLDTPKPASAAPLPRPPMICPGCPYRLFGQTVQRMKKKGKLETCFGDIGCNSLLFFMNAVDTLVAMGASEANRAGYVLANPDKASKCISLLGDGTECHSGMDATRNTVFRHVPGVKVILDNHWTAMTGGQPGPTSPVNLAGQDNTFDLQATLAAHGANVVAVDGYDRKGIEKALTDALAAAGDGIFTTLVVTGVCIRKAPRPAPTRMAVDAEACKRCGLCQICPGITADGEGLPSFTNLCTTCMGQKAACAQMCPVNAISPEPSADAGAKTELPEAPAEIPAPASFDRPSKISVAIRGVGGQGNLFFGRVLTQLAFLAGYGDTNVVKGETHGMAQMGGPVISTFSCGRVVSPVLLPGTADCLVSMEASEVLRPGFVDMLKPGGTVLLARTKILPYGASDERYPAQDHIADALRDYVVVEVGVLEQAMALGDHSGRIANVVMMGALSTLAPFSAFPVELWLTAIQSVSPKPAIWNANYAAFNAGRRLL